MLLLRISTLQSEHIFESELQNSAAAPAKNLASVGIRQSSVAGVRDGRVRRSEVEMVERVQAVEAQLKAAPFPDGIRFLQADVPIPKSRTKKHVASRVSVHPGLRRCEGIRVEPLHPFHNVVAVLLP